VRTTSIRHDSAIDVDPSSDVPREQTSGFLAGKREVDLYVRTYNTLLRSTGPIKVETLVPAHVNIQSSLHAGATEPAPDMNAFIYSTMRLPKSIVSTKRIVLGQSPYVFARHGYSDLGSWNLVSAPGRRRRWYDNREGTLAAYVASSSDLDDLVPTIVAWQIEWNKMHEILREEPRIVDSLGSGRDASKNETTIRERLRISERDWERLKSACNFRF
jgi:hypothetical protein